MRVLIAENNNSRKDTMIAYLSNMGFNTYACYDADEAIELAKIYDYDIMVLSMHMPGGKNVIRELRANRINTPIMVIMEDTAPEKTADILSYGADDVMQIPLAPVELSARLTAIIRRSKGHAQSIINTGKITVNLDAKTVEVSGKPVHLTGKEYQMLELFSLRKGMTLAKEVFLDHLYGGMDEPKLKIIDVFVCRLRKKLSEATQDGSYIKTVWGRGYRMDEPQAKQALPEA